MGNNPICLHPKNHRYFLFRGKPTVMITCGEHYGAVMNLDFDYRPYLDVLKSDRLNLTRLFSGSTVEGEKSIPWLGWGTNTLAPKPKRIVVPWQRSKIPGYVGGGNKFDLSRWDGAYFKRLKDFVTLASKRGIVVEYVFFSQQYTEYMWAYSPMHSKNNINNVPRSRWDEVVTTNNPVLFKYQTELVKKVVTELNEFDNVYYEICNEPNRIDFLGGSLDWHNHLIETIVDTEASLPRKHLIATDYDQADMLAQLHPAVSVHNIHYRTGDFWIGAYFLTKMFTNMKGALAFDETSDADRGNTLHGVRADGWEFILSGGAVYDHLCWSYTPGDEAGMNIVGRMTRRSLGVLKNFIEQFDFLSMRPEFEFNRTQKVRTIADKDRRGAQLSVLSNPGREYAIYYKTKDGPRNSNIDLALPAGRYRAKWIDPQTGSVLAEEKFRHKGGVKALPLPMFAIDCALGIWAV